MKLYRLLAAFACPLSLFAVTVPIAASADPVCGDVGYYTQEDSEGAYADVSFNLDSVCTEGDSVMVLGSDWPYGGQYGANGGVLYQLLSSTTETVIVTVSYGETTKQITMYIMRH